MTNKTKPINASAKLLLTAVNFILRYRTVVLIFTLILLAGDTSIAQPPPPGGTGPPCWPPPCIPIDGGIGWLIAAGVAYGAKKSFDLGKKEEEVE